MIESTETQLTELQKLKIIAGALSEKGYDCEEGSIEQGEYRQCLAYVLHCIHTHVPPLHQSQTVSLPMQEIVIAQG